MVRKVITFFAIALLALNEARPPISKQSVKIEKLSHVGSHEPEHHEAWAYPSYEFKYEVIDPHTHDFKEHHETRNGDEVKGEYWLIQPDGLKRTVKYYADKSSGFKAHVDFNKLHHHYEENNEENASGKEVNSNEEHNSVEHKNSHHEEEGGQNEQPESDNEGESASVGEHSENEHEWRRNGVNFWGQRRENKESHDDQNGNGDDNEEEAGSKHNEKQEDENGEESNNKDEHDSSNEETSKKEKHVIKHEYHFIIHHPKHNKKFRD